MRIELTKKLVGQVKFDKGVVDITDPGYDKDVWCRSTAKILPGTYNCYAYEGVARGEPYKRVWIAQIVHADTEKDAHLLSRLRNRRCWRRIASIGVDAGLAGFFQDKPDFGFDEWHELCDWMFAQKENAYIKSFEAGDGFWTESGFGDGEYEVCALRENRKIVALEIRF